MWMGGQDLTSVLLPIVCSNHADLHVTTGAVCVLQAMSFKYMLAINGLEPSGSLVAELDTAAEPVTQ